MAPTCPSRPGRWTAPTPWPSSSTPAGRARVCGWSPRARSPTSPWALRSSGPRWADRRHLADGRGHVRQLDGNGRVQRVGRPARRRGRVRLRRAADDVRPRRDPHPAGHARAHRPGAPSPGGWRRCWRTCWTFFSEMYVSRHHHISGAAVHDPCAVMALTHPQLFTSVQRHVQVETEGALDPRDDGDRSARSVVRAPAHVPGDDLGRPRGRLRRDRRGDHRLQHRRRVMDPKRTFSPVRPDAALHPRSAAQPCRVGPTGDEWCSAGPCWR